MKEVPTCKCGLKMRNISHLAYIHGVDWWECECGNGYDRFSDMWVF